MKRWVQIGAGLLLLGILLVQGSQGLASPLSRPPRQGEAPPPAWQEAIERIDQALESGEITLEQAVRLRLQALREPFALPEEYRPRFAPPAYTRPPAKCGLPEAMAKVQALFRDRARWDNNTKAFIEQEFQRFEQEHRARLASMETLETEHFRIRWDPSEIPNGQAYASVLARYLEEAWTHFADAGYAMPDPSEYYTVLPTDPPTILYYDKIEVEIVSGDPHLCGLPFNASGLTMLITIQFNKRYLSTTGSEAERALAGHEFFHVIQWDYLGFRQVQCPFLGPTLFYTSPSNRGAWLMEGSSTWAEKNLYDYNNDLYAFIRDYHLHPEWSLFVFDVLRGDTNREYGTALFLWYLNNFYGDRYQQPIVKRFWEQLHANVPPLQKDTVDAVTEVLLHPDEGTSPYGDYPELWQSLFANFILADYLKGAYPALVGQPGGDWGTWPADKDLVTVLQEQNNQDAYREHHPAFPEEITLRVKRPPIEDPGAFIAEIFADQLNLPGGEDQTGATLEITFLTNCPYCAVDQLIFDAPTHALRTDAVQRVLFTWDNRGAQFVIPDFGASPTRRVENPTASEKVTLLFTSGAGGYGGWGNQEIPGVFNFFYYEIHVKDNPPITPLNLSATTANGDYPITLQWEPVREAGIRYNVYQARTQDVPVDDAHRIAQGLTETSLEIPSGDPGIYYFVVTAVDQGDNESEPSEPVQVVVGVTEVQVQIASGSEDAGPEPSVCAYATSWNEIYFGECTDGALITSGFRFGNVPVPQNAQVVEAYLEFTVDGPYDVPLQVRIYGEASGDAQPFSDTDRPENRPRTQASVLWEVPATDHWELGMTRRTPDLAALVQEIVSRPDWQPYHGMAFIFNTVSSASGQHRRVIGYERPVWYPGSEYAARLVIRYAGAIPPTPAPTPTPTPGPCALQWMQGQGLGVRDLGVFYRVRNKLAQRPAGQRYVAMYYRYSPALIRLLQQDAEVRRAFGEVLRVWRPVLQAWVEGRDIQLTHAQVAVLQRFLKLLAERGEPSLRAAVLQEMRCIPWAQLVGMRLSEAEALLLGAGEAPQGMPLPTGTPRP